MNVGELIEALGKFDPGWMVVVSGYEGGVDELRGAEAVEIVLNAPGNEPEYYGDHDVYDADVHGDAARVKAVWL